MTEKIGSLMIDLHGLDVTSEEIEILNHPLVGGVILFSRNYESRNQLQHLCQQIKNVCKKPRLIMVDQEGGRVQRFINEFTRLPYMAEFGKIYDRDANAACRMAKDCGWLMAIELLSTGIDLSLAPVLDLNKNISTVIGERAFHSNPESVIAIATSFINGMREAGMSATGKHFPGHGSVTVDSHADIPVDERSFQEILEEDMSVFSGMIKAGISAIMTAHIIFPNVESNAVSYSRFWLQDILRNKLEFNGVIFSDDLNMNGANISSRYSDRVIASREAGCDFVLLCNNRRGVIEVLDNIPFASHLIDKNKWGILQGNFSNQNLQNQNLQTNERLNDAREMIRKIS